MSDMIYDITLTFTFEYTHPVAGGRDLVRLLPADIPGWQRLIAGHVATAPHPAERTDRVDFFGNAVSEFSFRHPHSKIEVEMRARVDRPGPTGTAGPSTALVDIRDELSSIRDLRSSSPLHFIAPSIRAPLSQELADYARRNTHPGMAASQAVTAIGTALHRDMKFDPDATHVDTPAAEAFANRRGVCQDYTHIMITCLRSLGIPAGYVSGFLRTLPPPGKPRLEGADAMHAWVRAWCGKSIGWVEYDPTNALTPASDHVVVAYGRDYFDVAPVKGVVRAAGGQKSHQAVDMMPLQD